MNNNLNSTALQVYNCYSIVKLLLAKNLPGQSRKIQLKTTCNLVILTAYRQ